MSCRVAQVGRVSHGTIRATGIVTPQQVGNVGFSGDGFYDAKHRNSLNNASVV